LLTTESIVCEIPDEKNAQAPAAGMPGMGGMGGMY
jgi:hypothetical protein